MTSAAFIHHIAIYVVDFEASERFYTAVLGSLGVPVGYRADGVVEYWNPDDDGLSLSVERAATAHAVTRKLHLAFAAPDRAGVERFHDAAVSCGARVAHPPRHWPEYRAYCVFVRDPAGNNVEALHKVDENGS